MSYLLLSTYERDSRFFPTALPPVYGDEVSKFRELKHNTWASVAFTLFEQEHLQALAKTPALRLYITAKQSVADSLQWQRDSQGRDFVTINGNIYWSTYWQARQGSGEMDGRHEHSFTGPMLFKLSKIRRGKEEYTHLPGGLYLAEVPSYDVRHQADQLLDAEIERIPDALYRKLVEHQPDERLRDFPWLVAAYRMAEYILSQENGLRARLLPEGQKSCRSQDAKYTLSSALKVWLILAGEALIHEVNYQLCWLQVMAHWPKFRLFYRIAPGVGATGETIEGFLELNQMRRFAYRREPFLSLLTLLAETTRPEMVSRRSRLVFSNTDPWSYLYHCCRRLCDWLAQYHGYIRICWGSRLFDDNHFCHSPSDEHIQFSFHY
jgi:hypothetical protein